MIGIIILLSLILVFILVLYKYYYKQNSIVLYYKEGCHYCDEFMPVWEEVKKNNPSVNMIKTNVLPDSITSVPTIIYGKSLVYNGGRSKIVFDAFVKQQA